jgi:hypothetical protein
MPNGVTFSPPQPPAPLTNVLTDTHIFVGDAANVPQDVALTLNATGGTFALANTGVLTMPNADAVTRGLLTAADWNTFTNKQNAIADWTTAFNSGTQATSSWSATNAAANVNAAIIPKGTGALIVNIPDGTVTGGNARGTYAVDLQRIRNTAARIASGAYSAIVAGSNNTASGSNSIVLSGNLNSSSGFGSITGGENNTATGSYCVSLGESNNATGIAAISLGRGNNNAGGGGGDRGSFAIGFGNTCNFTEGGGALGKSNTANNFNAIAIGQSSTASANISTAIGNSCTASAVGAVAIGNTNTASASYATTGGGFQGTASLYGQQAYAAGRFSANADAQAHELVWRRLVTGAPVGGTELFLDGASAAAILPSTNAIWHGIIDIAAICTATGNGTTVTGDVEATSYKVTIKRIGTNTVLVGTVQEIGTTNADASIASGVFTIDNNNTNESLRIVYTSPVTAGSTTTIRVVATFRGLQIQY